MKRIIITLPAEEGGMVTYPGERALAAMKENREKGVLVVEEKRELVKSL